MHVIGTFNTEEYDIFINLWMSKYRESYWTPQYLEKNITEWSQWDNNKIHKNSNIEKYRIIIK